MRFVSHLDKIFVETAKFWVNLVDGNFSLSKLPSSIKPSFRIKMNSSTTALPLIQENISNSHNTTSELATIEVGISTFNFIVLPFKILLSAVTALSNLVIMIVIIFMIKRRTYSNLIFLSMATADFFAGIISLPFMIIYSTFGYWPLGKVLCIAWCINDWSTGSLTLSSLLMISAHRYFQIKSPLKTNESLTKWRCIRVLALWPLTFFCWMTSILWITMTNGFDAESCYFTYTFPYVLVSDFLVFILPFILIVCFNVLTFIAIKSRPKSFHNAIEQNLSSIAPPEHRQRKNTAISYVKKTAGGQESQANNHRLSASVGTSSNAHQNRLKKDRHAFNCLICILVNLVINWCIFISAWPITAICPECVNGTAYEIGYWTAYIYSAVNAVILFVFHDNFRVGATNLLHNILCRSRQNFNEPARAHSIRAVSVQASKK